MGSNMAECHPVAFQWIVEAQRKGCKLIHVDPRFTRTSAMANLHVPIRAGSDIAFLGGLVHYILEQERYFRDYMVAYTNATTIIDERFLDTEDLDGFFSGWNEESGTYDTSSWQYEGGVIHASAGERGAPRPPADGIIIEGAPPHSDPTLEHPRCVFQLLRRHYSRYTPEMVERVCGVPQHKFLEVAETICDNSNRERTTAFVYAVGWTQHTVGVQFIRTSAIIQLLLGNMGRTGGGVMALRGHANIQGATDIATLFDVLPGYIQVPSVKDSSNLKQFCLDQGGAAGGYWGNLEAYLVSLLKAYWGDRATPDNQFGFDYLHRVTGDHSTYQSTLGMVDGWVKGFVVLGENPAVGSAHGGLHRKALRRLDWLVVRDLYEIETASFWYDSPETQSGEVRAEDVGTEVFFLPAAANVEKNGSFTNTQRLLQWHEQAVEPRGDCRSDLWFTYYLGAKIREKLAASTEARDRALLDLTWDYPLDPKSGDPSAEEVLREISGRGPGGQLLASFGALRADGSTSSGCWIYCGAFAGGQNLTNRKRPGQEQSWVAPEWGWAWPLNRRVLYNRASADPEGKPWSERKRFVYWDEAQGKWVGPDVPDFPGDRRPDYQPPPGATAENALSGDRPFIMQADGVGWLFAPSGVVDGPFPTHYEPQESPVRNLLYEQERNPARQVFRRRDNPYNPTAGEPGSERFPFVMSTYRLTEHHTAGGMTRFLSRLSQLQPEMFCEVSPELAQERGLRPGGWATISTERSVIEARVLVTARLPVLRLGDRVVHQVGLPYHWGSRGLSTGDSANDLFPLVLDHNVHIQETKAATCDIQPGRRPRVASR
jgi:formate dehydrogenase major subunit